MQLTMGTKYNMAELGREERRYMMCCMDKEMCFIGEALA
jgi:hypothetical protein